MKINDFYPKKPQNFVCETCYFITSNKKDYSRHILTKKHIFNTSQCVSIKKTQKTPHECICGKIYKESSGLWRHKKVCVYNTIDNTIDTTNNFNDFDKDNLIKTLIEQNAKLMTILENGTVNNSNNTTNSNNKAFNLNLFLNETCKNAMNITDFVDSIKLQLSDFMEVGEVGYVEGISNIIVKKLNALDETIRPIHCTDQKRETFYVKDEDRWEKEDEDKIKIKKLIKKVSFKNENLMKIYKEKYPDYNDPDSKRSDQYSKTVIEAMDCKEESREKIIKNISKATIIKSKM